MEPVYHADHQMNPDFPFKIYRRTGRMEQEMHAHDYLQLWFVQNGSCIHQFENRRYYLIRGDCFLLPPGLVHAVQSDRTETELIGLEFTREFLCEEELTGAFFSAAEFVKPFLVNRDRVRARVTLSGGVLRSVEDLISEMLEEFGSGEPLSELFIQADLLKLLAIMLREQEKCGEEKFTVAIRHREAVAETLDFIREHSGEKIYLEEVCARAALSPGYYARIFRAVTGRSFTEYVQWVRNEKARKLLTETDRTVENIALLVGYRDTASFDRAFKKTVGVTPLQFRRSEQKEPNS